MLLENAEAVYLRAVRNQLLCLAAKLLCCLHIFRADLPGPETSQQSWKPPCEHQPSCSSCCIACRQLWRQRVPADVALFCADVPLSWVQQADDDDDDEDDEDVARRVQREMQGLRPSGLVGVW